MKKSALIGIGGAAVMIPTALLIAMAIGSAGSVPTADPLAANIAATSNHAAKSQSTQQRSGAALNSSETCIQGVRLPAWRPSEAASSPQIACSSTGITGSQSKGDGLGTSAVLIYSLAGKTNANTIPADGGLDKLSDAAIQIGSYHPETDITLVINRGDNHLDTPLVTPYTNVVDIKLKDGIEARVTTSQNGLGVTRVEWLYDNNSYTLLSARGKANVGASGPTTQDLVAMAASTT